MDDFDDDVTDELSNDDIDATINQVIINSQNHSRSGIQCYELEPGKNRRGKALKQNIFTVNHGPTSYAKNRMDGSALSAFLCLVDKSMLKLVVECTESFNAKTKDSEFSITIQELLQFIAVLFCRGVFALNFSINGIWSKRYGIQIVKDLISRNKFRSIMRFLRFDDRNSRKTRVSTDKFALIRDVWDRFIENCQASYRPSAELTIDEQLLTSRSRCSFTQYMPNKPDKFGIKFWMLSEVDSKYIYNCFPYLGKHEEKSSTDLLGEFVVKKLTQPLLNKGYHVTCDNFFSSLRLAQYLKAHRTSFLGTVKSNKSELPSIASEKNLPLHSSKFFTTEDGDLLTIYQTKVKSNKNVIVLSTYHDSVHLDNTEKRKPSTIISYNQTKFGVDVVDQMTRKYTVKAPTRRWPVQVWYNILNLAAINAHILYQKVNNIKIQRRNFIVKLIEDILDYQPFDPIRSAKRKRMLEQAGQTTPRQSATKKPRLEKRRHCQIQSCQNKSFYVCSNCCSVTCGACSYLKNPILCLNCKKK